MLGLKVCDPACGSGAFLVEACRQLGERLEAAWARHPGLKPPVPEDEDDATHARRLVAQRCLYGVDRNPMAVDLARLSLWLATLAAEHEFTFLDHALKAGDSLVGLTAHEIERMSWAPDAEGGRLFAHHVRERVRQSREARRAIRTAPQDTERAFLELHQGYAERALGTVRDVGDAVVATFFEEAKAKARKAALQRFQTGFEERTEDSGFDLAARMGRELREGERPVTPFHWEVEFPEVWDGDAPGFDAVVGNPPFAGKNTISDGNGPLYIPWLQHLHEGAHGNADLVAHFFRRAFGMLREGGAFGLIATNTIGQGDTRATGLAAILRRGRRDPQGGKAAAMAGRRGGGGLGGPRPARGGAEPGARRAAGGAGVGLPRAGGLRRLPPPARGERRARRSRARSSSAWASPSTTRRRPRARRSRWRRWSG